MAAAAEKNTKTKKKKHACRSQQQLSKPVRRPARESNECEGRMEELLTREKSRKKVGKKKDQAEGVCMY